MSTEGEGKDDNRRGERTIIFLYFRIQNLMMYDLFNIKINFEISVFVSRTILDESCDYLLVL